ncbi:MAG: translation elongation factor 4 [Verrucomicrobiota bacterium]|nr:translation elongation factor 4 [Verrucomicrobiota bacterium]
MQQKYIRNFSIIAHIDHGKSTLADRMMQMCNLIDDRTFHECMLDDMDLEQERGITIKSHPVRMNHIAEDGISYEMNLIDTPGHVDFAYEVSRSLAACEGAVLLIDAAQGVQAQTVANVNLAMKQNLAIIPVINKIDLPSADIDLCLEQLEDILMLPAEDAVLVSAKENTGVPELLEAIVKQIPPPPQTDGTETKAIIFDSVYNPYRGVISYVRIFSGSLEKNSSIQLYSTGLKTELKEVGQFAPDMKEGKTLYPGTVGYIIPNLKSPKDTKIGDTVTDAIRPCSVALPGFEEIKPMVFSSLYPIDTNDYNTLKLSVSKLQLNDAAFSYQMETSIALGFGFRCGFLGLLHMEIIQERLRREFNMDIIATYPSVVYNVYLKNGTLEKIDNPAHLPDPANIDYIEEPYIEANIMLPNKGIGSVMNLIMEKRGECTKTENMDRNHIVLTAEIPLLEVMIDFHDKLKSITSGYGSMDYAPLDYRRSKLVKLDILVNGDPVDAFSTIVHHEHTRLRGKILVDRLKDIIPPQMFKIAIQASVGSSVIARSTVRALRKDVTSKCYGGDITRKRKLLEKQKAGKKRMKQVGKVNIPQEAFIEVLKCTE